MLAGVRGGDWDKMKDVFKDIVQMDGVDGVILLSNDGTAIFESVLSDNRHSSPKRDWLGLVSALNGVREADVIYRNARIYIRRSEIGYLLILMSPAVAMAMLRLNCDIVLPALKPVREQKGIKKFF